MQRRHLEIDSLDEGPEHPILGQSRGVGRLKLVLRTGPLHYRHTAEEDEHIGTSEYNLIGSDPPGNLEILVLRNDLILQELVPRSCSGTENSCGANPSLAMF